MRDRETPSNRATNGLPEAGDRALYRSSGSAAWGKKLRVWFRGPVPPLELFLDPDRFKVVDDADAADFRVVLNRNTCPDFLKTPPLISVGRGDLVLATAGR